MAKHKGHGGGSFASFLLLALIYSILWPIGQVEKHARRQHWDWSKIFQPRWKREGWYSPEKRYVWGNTEYPTDEWLRRAGPSTYPPERKN